MLAVFLELVARVCFSGIAIVNKFSRKDGASTSAVMGQYAWALPFFALLGAFLWAWQPYLFHLNGGYWIKLGLWLGLCLVLNYVIMFLSRYQSLIEMGGYKLGFSMLVSLAIDYFWYDKAEWSPVYIVGGVIAVAGGWLLSVRPLTQSETDNRVPLPFPVWVLFLLALAVAACAPLAYALYKDCLALSAHQPLLHTIFSQSVLFTAFWLLGAKDYDKARKAGHLPVWRVLLVASCVVLAALVQTWSIAALSVTSLMVLGLLSGAIVTASDIWSGEVAPTRRNILSIALVFIGSAMLALAKL